MHLQMNGKIGLVTGSTASIGLAIACRLAGEGVTVITNGRSENRVTDARLCFTAQCRAADRALPDEQYKRGVRPARIRQGPLPHRAGCGFLILTSEIF